MLILAFLTAAIGVTEPRLRATQKTYAERPVVANPYSHYFVFGHGKGVSAYLWIMLLSWYGGHVSRTKGSFLLRTPEQKAYVKQQVDMVIRLDPFFPDSYSFGVIVLSWYAKQPELALEFCRQGQRQFPGDWTYPFYCGFIHYHFLKDEATASKYFLEAGRLPKVPSYVPLLASKFARKQSDTQTALESMRALLASPLAPQLKEHIENEIKTLETVQRVERGVAEFQRRHKRVPSPVELIDAGLLEEMPYDTMGNRIIIKPDGKVEIETGANP